MKEYPHINTIWKRDEKGKIQIGQYSILEFEYLASNEWIWTEKIDGTNIRVMWDGRRVTLGGKTDNAQIPLTLVTKLLDLFPTSKFKTWNCPVCLYGEGFGARIQRGGGNYIPNGVSFIIFDIWFDGWWLNQDSVEEISNRMEIQRVPIIGRGTLIDAHNWTEVGFPSTFGNFTAEGLVLKPAVDLWGRDGKRVISKIKHKDFK
jgi:hypothetical protein